MENILFKKSYLLNNLKEIKFEDLWGSYGIFTTIRILGKPIKILFFKEHINFGYKIKLLAIAEIKNYKRINPKLKNLKYNKILSFLNNINTTNTEVIFSYKKILLEGCTTNVLFVSRNKIYSPVKNIYEGTTLRFFKRKIKTIKKKDIFLDRLEKFDEIILIGSGKGVVSVNSIDKPYWRRKSLKTYRFLSKIYQQAVTNCPRYND